ATLDTKNASQDTSITAAGPHTILSANHTDSVAATLVTGDVLRADATGKLARLPAGTNGQFLSVASGLPTWADPVAGPHSILSAQHPDTTPAGLGAGDFLVVDATGKLVRLPKAADGQLLSMVSGAPAWAAPVAPAWVDIPFLASNFTADTGAWTVTAGNISSLRYQTVGKAMFLTFQIQGTNVTTGSPVIRMLIPAPGGGVLQTLPGTVYNPITAF